MRRKLPVLLGTSGPPIKTSRRLFRPIPRKNASETLIRLANMIHFAIIGNAHHIDVFPSGGKQVVKMQQKFLKLEKTKIV
ncbi:MAG: hypothetical protein NC112_06445 [Oxalobacter formigenes]|nr:hypothetical protein [Oxalobacter formigenes]